MKTTMLLLTAGRGRDRAVNLCVAAVALVAALLIAAADVQAGVLTIYDTNLDPWRVSWADPDLTLVDTTPSQDPMNPRRTTDVKETKKFRNNFGIILVFEQLRASADAGGTANNSAAPSEGLNFVLDATITNAHPTLAMSQFEARLFDLTPVDPAKGTNTHPAIPHFHYTAAGAGAGNEYQSNPLKRIAGANPDSFFRLGLGTPVPKEDGMLTWKARIHEIVLKDLGRKFVLNQTPTLVPEPSVSALALMALANLGAMRFIRRRR